VRSEGLASSTGIGGSTPAALAADWLTSLLDQNAGGWDATPPLPARGRLHQVAADLFGLPARGAGVLTTGATTANFAGLSCAAVVG
jgi:glutamate/tyrosine decarboxylase-like PLP-dependent enzyme